MAHTSDCIPTLNQLARGELTKMYVYYILRGTKGDTTVEVEDDVTEEQFPGVDLTEGPDVINAVVQKLQEQGNTQEWTECDLTNEYFDVDNTYTYVDKRWIRHSDVPLAGNR
jgi:hypothetical protein